MRTRTRRGGLSGAVNLAIFDGNSGTKTKDAGWYGDNDGSLDYTITYVGPVRLRASPQQRGTLAGAPCRLVIRSPRSAPAEARQGPTPHLRSAPAHAAGALALTCSLLAPVTAHPKCAQRGG